MSRTTALLCLILFHFTARSQNETKHDFSSEITQMHENKQNHGSFIRSLKDKLFTYEKKDQLIKTGWNIGVLPAITYDTDLGIQYGVFGNLYHYGDGCRYPEYDHSFYLELSRYTKGSGVYRFSYDSDRLIPKLRTTVELSYLTDLTYDFYGFNGYDAVYNKSWTEEEDPAYKSRMFYKYDRKLFRWKVDLQGKLSGEKFWWITGLNFLSFKTGPVNTDRLNKGKDEEDLLPDVDGLYDKYIQWGLITEEEADGGFIPEFKAGLVIDTRDNRPNPMKGIWSEAVVVVSPEILGAESSFSKISFTHRQYFTLIPDDLSLALRLAWQSSLGGDAPFYYQSQIITSILKGSTSEGLGGSKTLRGIMRNRVTGDGIFFGNTELRWKLARFRFHNNNFYVGLNGFMDFGKVTKKIPVSTSGFDEFSLANNPADYFDPGAEKLHISYGTGLRIAMNENFIVAFDYGLASDNRDGNSGFYMGLNYLF
ncbi:MAG: BamA/TamA family outer membrane protein [Mangrovibacterium sp.]